MLAVIAEINCLNMLNKYGVYPDYFYTDLDRFMTDSVIFREADVMIIMAGCCAFSRRRIFDVIKHFNKRAETVSDKGINHVYVVSDTEMPYLGAYYKYTKTFEKCDVMRGTSCVVSNAFIWSKLQTDKKDTITVLSTYDKGDASKSREALDEIKKRFEEGSLSTDDNYRKYIKLPDLKKLLA